VRVAKRKGKGGRERGKKESGLSQTGVKLGKLGE
jgi:hypothetical protein